MPVEKCQRDTLRASNKLQFISCFLFALFNQMNLCIFALVCVRMCISINEMKKFVIIHTTSNEWQRKQSFCLGDTTVGIWPTTTICYNHNYKYISIMFNEMTHLRTRTCKFVSFSFVFLQNHNDITDLMERSDKTR